MILTIGLCLGLGAGIAFAAGFEDVGENDWFRDAVEYACDKGIMRGVTETAFEPDSDVDRTTLVTALYNYSVVKGFDVSVGEDTNILSYEDAFDIREGAYEAFQWACGSGLIPEEGATRLEPDEVVSREQMVMLLFDYAVLYGIDATAGEDTNILSYEDVFEIAVDEAYAAFQWACGSGVIVGTTDSTLSPSANATRAQLATVMMRLSAKERMS